MKLVHDDLSLWYGTPDAPAPLGDVVPRRAASLVVGVHPASPANAVHARFRIDGGITRRTPGRELRTDWERRNQYFLIQFPDLPTGRRVEFCPTLCQAGRQVPSPASPERFPSSFLLADESPAHALATPSEPLVGQRFAPLPAFLTAIRVRVDKPQFVGETPEGIRINFYAREGSASGARLAGAVLPGSNDHMIVRPDGVGIIRVRAAIATGDGAMFEVEEIGTIEFGPDGYERARAESLPAESPLVVYPRFLTGHPRYLWLNRQACIGVGRTRLDVGEVRYDIFTVSCSGTRATE